MRGRLLPPTNIGMSDSPATLMLNFLRNSPQRIAQGNSPFCSIELQAAVVLKHCPQKLSLHCHLASQKSIRRMLFYIVLAIEIYVHFNVSANAGFEKFFVKLFVDSKKV